MRHCSAALALEPDDPDVNELVATTLAAAGDLDAAGEHWRAALRGDPR
jgi:lipoprotein NlpI